MENIKEIKAENPTLVEKLNAEVNKQGLELCEMIKGEEKDFWKKLGKFKQDLSMLIKNFHDMPLNDKIDNLMIAHNMTKWSIVLS